MKLNGAFFDVFGLRALTVILLAGSMAGCLGGGSSGGGGSSTSTTPTVVITSSNAPIVTGASFDAAMGTTSLPLAAATTTPSSFATTAAMMQTIGKIATAAVKSTDVPSQAPAIATGVVTTEYCRASGSITVNKLESSVTRTFNNCSDVAGEVLSGTASISNVAENQSAGTMSAKGVLNLTMSMPRDTITISGDIYISATGLNGLTPTLHLSGSSLSYSSAATGSKSMVNYSIDMDGSGSMSMTFTFNSPSIGVATFTTVTPFHGTANRYPDGGQATVTGANSTKLRIIVLGDETAAVNSQVMLEVSADGGASYGIPNYVTWQSLNLTF